MAGTAFVSTFLFQFSTASLAGGYKRARSSNSSSRQPFSAVLKISSITWEIPSSQPGKPSFVLRKLTRSSINLRRLTPGKLISFFSFLVLPGFGLKLKTQTTTLNKRTKPIFYSRINALLRQVSLPWIQPQRARLSDFEKPREAVAGRAFAFLVHSSAKAKRQRETRAKIFAGDFCVVFRITKPSDYLTSAISSGIISVFDIKSNWL